MKAEADKYDNIELTCVSGEGDDNKENGLIEDCIPTEVRKAHSFRGGMNS